MTVGAIGAGKWGANVVRTLDDLGALAAIAEADTSRLDELRAKYPDARITSEPWDVIGSDVDAVAIATPAETHFALAKQAIEAGKDVFVEKPITLDVAEAETLAAMAEERGRVLMVGHLLLYQPAIQWIKQALEEGLIGAPVGFHQERLNLGRARAVENVLWSIGVHDVAVALYLAGDAPEWVQASGQCILQPSIEDDFYLHMRFPGGVQAHVHTSWLWPERQRVLTVIGVDGMLVYDEIAQTVTHHRKRIDAALDNQDEGSEIAFSGSGQPLTLEMQHFLECVATRKTPISDGRSAVEVLRVLAEAGKA